MFGQPVQYGIGAVASMNCDVGIDKVGQSLVPLSLGHFDRLASFDGRWPWQIAQSHDGILQALARRKDRDDIAEARDLQLDAQIGVGQFGRYPDSLTVAGLEYS